MLEALAGAHADVLFLEFANREMAEAELIARAGLPQILGAGVVDVKSFYRETAQDVAARRRRIGSQAPLGGSRLRLLGDAALARRGQAASAGRGRAHCSGGGRRPGEGVRRSEVAWLWLRHSPLSRRRPR
jgi:hypothetical protein